MKTNENQKSTREHKVYIHRLKTWVEVTEEQYYAYYRDIWATRKRAQAHGQCMCPKSKTWMCDGDCLACEFRAAGDNLSLDYTVEDGEGNQKSWADDLPDDTPNAQSIMEDRELLCALYQKLQELDPEGRRICELIIEGKSERDIGGTPKYSVSLIIPKSDTKTVAKIKAAIEAAYQEGQSKLKGNSKSVPPLVAIKTPLRDGDIERPDDPAYANAYFINANSATAPGIVDADRNPVLTRSEVYSGVYGRASINLYAFNSNGNKGIACGLNNLQLIRAGEPLGGKASAESDFATDADDDFLA